LIYFLLGGRLPWMGIVANTPDQMIKLIGNVKRNLPLEKLCQGQPSKFLFLFLYYIILYIYLFI